MSIYILNQSNYEVLLSNNRIDSLAYKVPNISDASLVRDYNSNTEGGKDKKYEIFLNSISDAVLIYVGTCNRAQFFTVDYSEEAERDLVTSAVMALSKWESLRYRLDRDQGKATEHQGDEAIYNFFLSSSGALSNVPGDFGLRDQFEKSLKLAYDRQKDKYSRLVIEEFSKLLGEYLALPDVKNFRAPSEGNQAIKSFEAEVAGEVREEPYIIVIKGTGAVAVEIAKAIRESENPLMRNAKIIAYSAAAGVDEKGEMIPKGYASEFCSEHNVELRLFDDSKPISIQNGGLMKGDLIINASSPNRGSKNPMIVSSMVDNESLENAKFIDSTTKDGIENAIKHKDNHDLHEGLKKRPEVIGAGGTKERVLRMEEVTRDFVEEIAISRVNDVLAKILEMKAEEKQVQQERLQDDRTPIERLNDKTKKPCLDIKTMVNLIDRYASHPTERNRNKVIRHFEERDLDVADARKMMKDLLGDKLAKAIASEDELNDVMSQQGDPSSMSYSRQERLRGNVAEYFKAASRDFSFDR